MSKIDYRPKEAVAVIDEDIMMGDVCIGWVKQYTNALEKLMYHAGLQINVNDQFPALIQGHGETKEAAIKCAFNRGHQYATALLSGIDRLQAEIGINTGRDELQV